MRDGLKMCGVHASAVAAKVVQFQAKGDSPYQLLIGQSMNDMERAFVDRANLSVPAGINARRPDPARTEIPAVRGDWAMLIHTRPEP